MSRVLSALVVIAAVGVAAVWSSSVRLPGGIAVSPIIVTSEVEHNILLMPVTGQEVKLISPSGEIGRATGRERV